MRATVYAKPVEVLGSPVGNLWDVFVDAIRWRRYTYHGNRLVHVRIARPDGIVANAPSVSEIEAAIQRIYL